MHPFTIPVQVWRAALLGIALLLAAPASVTAADSPAPDPVVAGSYLNLPNCHFGSYRLQRTGARVALVLTSFVASATCLENTSGRAMFVLPPTYRPPMTIVREVAVTPGPRFLVPKATCRAACRVRLRVEPNGRVHYETATPSFYLVRPEIKLGTTNWGGTPVGEFALSTDWGTTPSANDQVVLTILDELWFGSEVLSRIPAPTREIPFTSPVSEVEFFYLALNPEGRVTELNLGGHRLSAHIPPELGELTGLKHLNLSTSRRLFYVPGEFRGYGLTGTIPRELGQLPQLRELVLAGNLLTGPVPPELGQLASLQELSLNDNLLTGPIPPELGQLAGLQELHLHNNLLTGPIPPELGQLPQLRELNLKAYLPRHVPGTWLPWFQVLLNSLIEESLIVGAVSQESESGFQLVDFQLTGPIPPELGQLKHLTHLALQHNQLTGRFHPNWDNSSN